MQAKRSSRTMTPVSVDRFEERYHDAIRKYDNGRARFPSLLALNVGKCWREWQDARECAGEQR